MEGIPQGVEIFYIVNGVETQENPAYRDAGSYEVNFVLRGPNYEDYYGFGLIDIRALSGIVSEGYEGIWDGKAHTIELYGPEAEDVVYYRVGENGEETTVKPQFTDVGKYTIYYRVERYLNGVFSIPIAAWKRSTSCRSTSHHRCPGVQRRIRRRLPRWRDLYRRYHRRDRPLL